jgi:hypothetical protein
MVDRDGRHSSITECKEAVRGQKCIIVTVVLAALSSRVVVGESLVHKGLTWCFSVFTSPLLHHHEMPQNYFSTTTATIQAQARNIWDFFTVEAENSEQEI